MTDAFRRVLAATDFSPAADAAARRAFAFCSGPGSRVILCHVIDLPGPPNPLYAHYSPRHQATPEELAQIANESRRALEALVPEDGRSQGRQVEVEVRVGTPLEELLNLAEETQADVLVLGHSGRGALSRAFLGSLTDRLVHHAPCSVLVVRGSEAKAPQR